MKPKTTLIALFFTISLFIFPKNSLAAIQSLNGQTGQNQTFTNDSNILINSANNIHTINWNGLLPISRGGTNNDSFTEGSVIFMGQNKFRQDNNNLFWDRVNNRLGIGTSSPTAKLDVAGNALISGNLDVSGNITSANLVPYTGATYDLNLGVNVLRLGTVGPNGSQDTEGFIRGEDATTADTYGGWLGIKTGSGHGSGYGGSLEIGTGNGGENGNGGEISINPGNGGTISGNGGNISIAAGSAINDGNGGGVEITAGSGGSTFGNGGDISMMPGLAQNGFDTNGKVKILDSRNFLIQAAFGTDLLTTSQTFSFPDASGTFGLLQSDQTWSGSNKFETNTNSTIYVGSSLKSCCIALGDSDNDGLTYITANDGVLSASSTKPAICQ